jgi:hypothetical protein
MESKIFPVDFMYKETLAWQVPWIESAPKLPIFQTCHNCCQIGLARSGIDACSIQAAISEEIGHIIDWGPRGQ